MSQSTQLKASLRHQTGKVANRNLRRTHKIPASLFGPGRSQMLEMDEEPTRRFLNHQTSLHQLVTLTVVDENGQESQHQVLVQEIQKHPYKHELLHLDFRELDTKKRLIMQIPLKVVGTAPGIKKGGVLQMIVRTVPVTCPADNIPEFIEVDVSNLDVNQMIRVQDLNYPENVKSRVRQNYTVVSVIGKKKLEAAAAAAEAAASGEAASAAEAE